MPRRRSPLSRVAGVGRGTSKARPKRKPRKPSETLRAYGPPERRAWVRSLPCLACNAVSALFGMASAGTSHNAHTVSGGKGRKADACTIVPLCASHHRRYDDYKPPFDTAEARQAMKDAAVLVEANWQAIAATLTHSGAAA